MANHRFTRREFVYGSLSSAALLGAGLRETRLLAANAPEPRKIAANDTVNVAVVGCGGRGADDLHDLRPTGANIVALCDVDESHAAQAFTDYPQARRYQDWRRMLDKEASKIDAVLVAIPDHNHAIVSIAAMKLGKHVYCEKPLAHSIWEVRRMAAVAAESGVATQMGTQGHAFEGTRQAVEVIRSGALGEVRELHVWTDRPKGWWPQDIGRPADTPPVPGTLNWDVWLGPAPPRPYNPAYVPFKWRGWWDFRYGRDWRYGCAQSRHRFLGSRSVGPHLGQDH